MHSHTHRTASPPPRPAARGCRWSSLQSRFRCTCTYLYMNMVSIRTFTETTFYLY